MKNIRSFLLSISFLIVVILACSNGQVKTDLSVSADELVKNYNEDENKADKKYKYKWLSVTGKVSNFELDDDSSDELSLKSRHGGNVTCKFNINERKKLRELNEDDEVTVIGYCEGNPKFLFLDMGVTLDNCEFKKADGFFQRLFGK